MLKNKFIFINENLVEDIEISTNSKINFLCIPNACNLEVDILLKKIRNCSSKINFVVLSDKNVQINIQTFLEISNSNSSINVFAIAIGKANIKIDINSIIGSNNVNSKVDQRIKGILLSDDAQIIGNPKLKIDSNEVIATHSLSIGGIDKEEEFFLLSKGFSKYEAKQLIINSYINNVMNSLNEKEYNIYINKINELLEKGSEYEEY